jgi:ferritin-like metal-binding protein YciE
MWEKEGLIVGKVETLHELFIEELEDIYNAERQLRGVLPRLADGASSVELGRALHRRLGETEVRIARLERIFYELQESPRGRKSRGMEALLEEGKALLDRDGDEDVLDAALIGTARRISHFEIAAYTTASAHARAIGHRYATRLLELTLEEEEMADRALSHLADGGLSAMAAAFGGDVGESMTRSYP